MSYGNDMNEEELVRETLIVALKVLFELWERYL